MPLDVSFAVSPAHPSNQLTVERTSNGRERPPVRAWPDGRDPATGAQRFRALLPPAGAGRDGGVHTGADPVGPRGRAYCPRARRAAWPWPRPPVAPDGPAAAARRAVPRYEWASEFLGAFTVQLAKPPESFGPAPDGLHITFYIASGEIHGPKINATIRGEGGDWMLVRRDGVGVADVRITYETDDGALLLSRYYGIFDLGPDGYERALRNEYDPVPPLVLAPQFVTSHPNWLWLNRLQCLAVGRVTMADLLVRFDLYAIRAGQPLPSSGLPRVDDAALIGDVH